MRTNEFYQRDAQISYLTAPPKGAFAAGVRVHGAVFVLIVSSLKHGVLQEGRGA